MTKDAFKERERALEEEFFRRVDRKLLDDLKAKLSAEAARQQLAAATGFGDAALLNELVQQGVSAEAVAAVNLIPLVLVAWADGRIDAKERPLVQQGARDLGIAAGTPADQLLNHWLDNKPAPELATAWKHYVQIATRQMSVESRAALCADVLRRAREIAKVSGGALSFGSISPSEKRVIVDLEEAFPE